MFCQKCGRAADATARFCIACGAPLTAEAPTQGPAEAQTPPGGAGEERVLHRFGAFGVGITWGRPALFAWTKYNMFEVVLTDRRVCAVRNPSVARMLVSSKRGQLYFQVPLADVVSMELLTFMSRKAVWLKWREGEATKEVSIECNVFKSGDILRFHQLLQGLLQARGLAV